LTSDLLIAQRRRVAAQVNLSGALVLAGILRHEFDSVAAAYAALGFGLATQSARNEWKSGDSSVAPEAHHQATAAVGAGSLGS